MAFEGAAYNVVAQNFQLVDPYGLISGFLGNGNSTGAFPTATDYSELGLLHNDSAVVDSTLRWSRLTGGSGVAGNEYAILRGPALAAAGSNRPRVVVARTAVEGTYIQIDSGRDNGAADATVSDIFMQTDVTQIRAKTLAILNSVETRMYDIAGPTDRGVVYGVMFDDAILGVSTSFGSVATGSAKDLLTINTPNFPIAGGSIEAFGIIRATQNAADVMVVTIRVDGVDQFPRIVTQQAAGTNGNIWSNSTRVRVPVGVGTHTVVLHAEAVTGLNSYTASNVDTGLQCVYHR